MRQLNQRLLIAVFVGAAAICLYSVISPSRSLSASQEPAAAATQAPEAERPPILLQQTQEEADAKSAGCRSCHTTTDALTMHASQSVRLGCTDCHGGDASARVG